MGGYHANPADPIATVPHYIFSRYNTHRMHSTLNYQSLADYEKVTT